MVNKEVLSERTNDYKKWVEAYARNHGIPIEWAEKGVRKEDYVVPALCRLTKKNGHGVYFIFRSMEQGRTFPISLPGSQFFPFHTTYWIDGHSFLLAVDDVAALQAAADRLSPEIIRNNLTTGRSCWGRSSQNENAAR